MLTTRDPAATHEETLLGFHTMSFRSKVVVGAQDDKCVPARSRPPALNLAHTTSACATPVVQASAVKSPQAPAHAAQSQSAEEDPRFDKNSKCGSAGSAANARSRTLSDYVTTALVVAGITYAQVGSGFWAWDSGNCFHRAASRVAEGEGRGRLTASRSRPEARQEQPWTATATTEAAGCVRVYVQAGLGCCA